jgi:hypothetical protein
MVGGANVQWENGLVTRGAVLVAVIAAALGLICAKAAPAHAGQIVYAAGTGIWAMNEDGSGKRELVDATQVPDVNFIGDPDVQPNGSEVAFMGRWSQSSHEETAFGPAPGFCGGNCEGYYELKDGSVTRMTPPPFDCAGNPCASYEFDPRVASDGSVAYVFQEWTSQWEWTGVVPILGRSALLSRDASGGSQQQWQTKCQWTTAANEEATEGDILAVDPADPGEIAYANCAEASEAGCEWPYAVGYDVYLSGASRASADDELVRTVTDPEAACLHEAENPIADLSFSPDGSHLVEMHGGPGAGIYTYPATAGGGASAHEVVEITGDWLFYSVRYIGGGRVAVSAGEDSNHDGTADHIDIYAMSSTCTPATCSLATGQGVANLTASGDLSSDALLNTSNFGYTTSTTPVTAVATPATGPGTGTATGTGSSGETRKKKGSGSSNAGVTANPKATIVRIPAQRLRVVLAKGLRAVVSCSAACHLSASFLLAHRLAARLHLLSAKSRGGSRPVAIGHGTASLRKAGKATVVVRFSKKARHALRHARSLRLVLRIVVTGSAGSHRTLSKSVLIKR